MAKSDMWAAVCDRVQGQGMVHVLHTVLEHEPRQSVEVRLVLRILCDVSRFPVSVVIVKDGRQLGGELYQSEPHLAQDRQ